MSSKLDPFFEEKLKSPDLRDDMKYENRNPPYFGSIKKVE
jgi:hypothetical protein